MSTAMKSRINVITLAVADLDDHLWDIWNPDFV